jgi:phospholipid N-methyltransferase
MRVWTECRRFFRESRRNFHTTGSVIPSSRFLARALASELAKPRSHGRILEVGPGTGAVTAQILKRLVPGDTLDLVELNPQFVELLQTRLDTDWKPWRTRHEIRLIHAALETVAGEGIYDFMISGLPHNNFPVEQVQEIYRAYRRLLKPGAPLSYFEYLWVRHIKSPFAGAEERARLHGVGRVVTGYLDAFQVRRQTILPNVPPAVVRHLRFQPGDEVPAATH